MGDFQLTTDQMALLKVLHRTLRDKRFAYRVNAVHLLPAASVEEYKVPGRIAHAPHR